MPAMIQEAEVVVQKKPSVVTAEGFRRLDYIDGLRGFAALWVALSHFYPGLGIWDKTLFGRLLITVSSCNQRAVMIFLVISGFCLFYPLVKKNAKDPQLGLDYKAFMVRRARRILPPYYAALVLCLALVFICPAWSTAAPERRFTWPSLLSHLLLIHNLIPGHEFTIDFPMWSIGLEWQLYLLFPFMVWAARRYTSQALLFGSLVLLLATGFLHHGLPSWIGDALRAGPFSYAFIFIVGMEVSRWSVASRKLPIPRGGIWVLMLGLFYVAMRGYGGGLVWSLVTALGTACLLMLAADEQGVIYRLLNTRWLVQIGTFSYSLYLMHVPILFVVMRSLHPWLHSPMSLLAGWMFIACPCALAGSYLFHLAFEKPFMGKMKSIGVVLSDKPIKTGSI